MTVTTSTASAPAILTGTYSYVMTFFDAETNTESPVTRSLLIDDGLSDIFGTAFSGLISVVNGATFKTIFDKTSLISYLQKHKRVLSKNFRSLEYIGRFFPPPQHCHRIKRSLL